jgi:hypothetical protein
MLSLIDLLEDGTVDLPLAGYLAAAMRGGASVMVGANPGGAGKTTVMCALLNWVPNVVELCAADGGATLEQALADPPDAPEETCYIAHEIGSGPYFAYVWGENARRFFALRRKGYLIGTNLHADTLAEAQAQLLRSNGVVEADLAAVEIMCFLRVERARGWQRERTLATVYESDGDGHRLLWESDRQRRFHRRGESRLVTEAEAQRHAEQVAAMCEQGIRRIEEVRDILLDQGAASD